MSGKLWDMLNKLHSSGLSTPEEFAEFFEKEKIRFAPKELASWGPFFASRYGRRAGMFPVPEWLAEVFGVLAAQSSAKKICDPWAGIGFLVAILREASKATTAFAFTPHNAEYVLGKVFVPEVDWRVGQPLELLHSAPNDLDLAASIVPIGIKAPNPLIITSTAGERIELRDDLGNLVMISASLHLNSTGIALFVVTSSFFSSRHSVFRRFNEIGLGAEAALALPPGTFAPYTNIPACLIVVRRASMPRLFVAELSSDTKTNSRILENLQQKREGGSFELGLLIDPNSFTGFEALRAAERIKEASSRFAVTPLPLGYLATDLNLGRHDASFDFPVRENAIFIPLLGNSRVLQSVSDLTLKKQNYAQVVIDPGRSNNAFVARFLNSRIGREILEASKQGFIPRLNKKTLQAIPIVVPSLPDQREILRIETQIAAEQNTISELEIELSELHDELWSNPSAVGLGRVSKKIAGFAERLSGNVTEHAAERLDQWFETIPFPLASILRAWQATSTQDFKTRYEHLLHFFEAAAEFISIILLSAFSSNRSIFEPHRQTLFRAMRNQNLGFERATFGTWKIVVEYFGKQLRDLLRDGGKTAENAKNNRELCVEMFSDRSLSLALPLSHKQLADVFSVTNSMRNEWAGHGGVVGQQEARLRNEKLLAEVQRLRETMADAWLQNELISALHCRPRRNVFENEIALLMGSNSEFLKKTREMSMWLDVERLYVSNKEANRALKLLPLIRIGPSPQSANNAFYFFNRMEHEAVRFISYHFSDQPELKDSFSDAAETIRFLTQVHNV